jgi:four helix bundle protein
MERTNFENLQIYRLAEKLSDQLWKIVVRWDVFARDTVGKQLVRAGDSIGANIAEGSGREPTRRFVAS